MGFPTGSFYLGILTSVSVGLTGYLKAAPNDNFEIILQRPSSIDLYFEKN